MSRPRTANWRVHPTAVVRGPRGRGTSAPAAAPTPATTSAASSAASSATRGGLCVARRLRRRGRGPPHSGPVAELATVVAREALRRGLIHLEGEGGVGTDGAAQVGQRPVRRVPLHREQLEGLLRPTQRGEPQQVGEGRSNRVRVRRRALHEARRFCQVGTAPPRPDPIRESAAPEALRVLEMLRQPAEIAEQAASRHEKVDGLSVLR
eukprot:scaffold9151_cov111-Isochrysis_galbana.AAC.3